MPYVVSTKPKVRRLTPKECQRLQGFPDGWGELPQVNDMSQEDYLFWQEQQKEYALIQGKTYKPKTKPQMIAWYNKLHSDSAEYKMWGNGVALPCVRYLMEGLAEVGCITLGSLFDGSGGFPLAGILAGMVPLWSSEVEAYPIAVTRERFINDPERNVKNMTKEMDNIVNQFYGGMDKCLGKKTPTQRPYDFPREEVSEVNVGDKLDRKKKDFLPSKCVDELKEKLDSRIRMFNGESTTPQMKKVAEGVSVAKIILNGWLESYTTEEPEGVEPVKKTLGGLAEFFFCGHCEDCEICWTEHGDRNNYCPNCGTKIKWEVE